MLIKHRYVIKRGKEYPTCNKKKEGELDWSHLGYRTCLLKHVIEGKKEGVEVTGRRGSRGKQLLDDLKGARRYCKLKEEALDHTL